MGKEIFHKKRLLLGSKRHYNLRFLDMEYRGIAQQFYRVEVKNGETTSFWFDEWSNIGCLYEKLGIRGCIDLGI